MIVVADTTPLNYLVIIGHIELLPALYQSVLIPQEVHRELQRPGTPPTVRAWASAHTSRRNRGSVEIRRHDTYSPRLWRGQTKRAPIETARRDI
jgi:predicted nucleic acid-binding protein